VGTGLIGGSFALAARAHLPGALLVGWDKPDVLKRACARGVVDEGFAELADALAGADLVYVALPVGLTIEKLRGLYRIVTNVCLDHMRRRRSRPEDQAPVSASALRGDLPERDFFDGQSDSGADPEQSLLGQEIGERIGRALAVLSPRERLIFELKHNQGMRLRAIGETLGTTEETVKNSLFRATRKLRAQLGELR
jgi:RNA polymerase sigma factor (sigma-70 family)